MKWHLSIKLNNEINIRNITCDDFTIQEHTGILVCYDIEGNKKFITNAFNSNIWINFVAKRW